MELTVRDLKELISGQSTTMPRSSLHKHMLSKMVMVRTYSAGVHFGILEEKHEQEVILTDARRVWSWTKAATLSQLAMEGSGDIDGYKISMPVDQILLNRVIEVIPMSKKAIQNLSGAKEWKC